MNLTAIKSEVAAELHARRTTYPMLVERGAMTKEECAEAIKNMDDAHVCLEIYEALDAFSKRVWEFSVKVGDSDPSRDELAEIRQIATDMRNDLLDQARKRMTERLEAERAVQ